MALTPSEALMKKMNDNDAEITELKGWIEGIQNKESLTPREEDNLKAWRSRLDKLMEHNRELTQQITELNKPPVQAAQPGTLFSIYFSGFS